MKSKFSNILTAALIITTIGFLMDGDVKESSVIMRFVEFILMTGILFTLISIFYFSFNFVKRNLQKA